MRRHGRSLILVIAGVSALVLAAALRWADISVKSVEAAVIRNFLLDPIYRVSLIMSALFFFAACCPMHMVTFHSRSSYGRVIVLGVVLLVISVGTRIVSTTRLFSWAGTASQAARTASVLIDAIVAIMGYIGSLLVAIPVVHRMSKPASDDTIITKAR